MADIVAFPPEPAGSSDRIADILIWLEGLPADTFRVTGLLDLSNPRLGTGAVRLVLRAGSGQARQSHVLDWGQAWHLASTIRAGGLERGAPIAELIEQGATRAYERAAALAFDAAEAGGPVLRLDTPDLAATPCAGDTPPATGAGQARWPEPVVPALNLMTLVICLAIAAVTLAGVTP